MSIPTKTPRLIPIIAAVVMLGIVVIGLTQCGSKAPAPQIGADRQTGSSRAEGDTPAEVLVRVTQRQTEMEAATRDSQKQLDVLQNQMTQLLNRQGSTTTPVGTLPLNPRPVELDQVRDAEIDKLRRQLKSAQDDIERMRGNRGSSTPAAAAAAGSDIPPDFGYEAADGSRAPAQVQPKQQLQPARALSNLTSLLPGGSSTSPSPGLGLSIPGVNDWITVRPLDVDGTSALAVAATAVGNVANAPARSLSAGGSRNNQQRTPEEAMKQVYTIPANATLLGSQAMTAIIGRIPTSGSVSDPYPFKVLTGAENLASNGIEIPGLEGMVWQGTAVGDWGLGCVRGSLDQVTFTFEDGTIRTVNFEMARRESGNQQQSSKLGDSLGWISDERGICVEGERITNAAPVLAARTGVAIFDAAAKALSRAETTTTLSQITGAGQEYVTGDVARYAGFAGLGAGADDLKRWLDQRLNQIFDAVYAPPGQSLAIHTNVEIAIDYDPIGRKVDHEQVATSTHDRTLD